MFDKIGNFSRSSDMVFGLFDYDRTQELHTFISIIIHFSHDEKCKLHVNEDNNANVKFSFSQICLRNASQNATPFHFAPYKFAIYNSWSYKQNTKNNQNVLH
jgi:hypothetical protein